MPSTWGVVDSETAQRYQADQQPGAALQGDSGMPVLGGRAVYEPSRKRPASKWWSEQVPAIEVCPPVDTATGVQLDLLLTGKYSVYLPPGGDPWSAEWLRRQWSLENRPLRRWTVETPYGPVEAVSDPWEVTLRRLARSVYQGAACFEWDTYVGQRPEAVYLTRLYSRAMRSIQAFLVDPQSEALVGVQQWVQQGMNYGLRDIPVSQMALLSYRKRGDTDFDGFGLWRSIAATAENYTETANLLMIGGRRFAVPGIDVEIDVELAQQAGAIKDGDVDGWVAAEVARAKTWAKRHQSGEEASLVRPKWWKIATFGESAYDPEKIIQQATHYAETIFWQLTADALIVGGTQAGGSYSAAEVKVERSALAMQNIAEWILGELDLQVNSRLLRMNFPSLDPALYPRIQVELRPPVFVQKFAELVQLANIGLPITMPMADAIYRAIELPAYRPQDERITFAVSSAKPNGGAM